MLLSSCTSSTGPYSILEFSGKGEIYNYSRSVFPILYEADSINSTALLAGDGDLIVYGDNNCFYYRKSSQNNFSIKTINNTGYINEKINSITIPGNDDMIPWFRQMKAIDISALDFLNFDTVVSKTYIPYLADLAHAKPDIGVGYSGDLTDLDQIFRIIKPEFIVGANLSQEDFGLLSVLSNLEFLSVSLFDSIYTIPLPHMPELKQLILADIRENAIRCDDFLVNNKQLERLTITGSTGFNLLLIEPLDNLKELIINGPDTIENFDLIKNHKQIELLSVTGDKLINDQALKELNKIRWITFDEDATQDGFKAFIESHPDVEIVEIINNDTINNLHPLLNLRNLYGLTVTDTLTDFVTVKSLKTLKYLSLPQNVLDDSIKKAELQRFLPDTKIVANYGVCLGSGWLLLIIPLIILLRIFNLHKGRKVINKI